MLWLVWHMWILLLLAFAGGVIAGWILRSRSDEAPEPAALTAAPAKPSVDPEPAAEAPPAPHVPAPAPSGEAAGAKSADGGSRVAAAFTAPEPSTPGDAKPKAKAEPGSDDLTAIKGLGPKAAEKLQASGVTRLAQIAAWSAADIEKYDEALNARGRIARDDWVGQAKALSKG
jgi:predicted flap endonuclease-1-like 5' DNA nuclease